MMRLTFKSLFSFKVMTASTPQEPPYRWCCAISHTTSQPITKVARTSGDQWERLLVEFREDPRPLLPSTPVISNRWMEYHGGKNWEGLLDPLDDGLRGEIIRYGSFVEAAYQSFDFDPSSPTFASCKYTKTSILERSGVHRSGYRVTKHLHATSSIPLPRWIETMPRWMQVKSSWVGYVAVCEDEEEISRLGRRDIVIALRGTATCLEWLENLRTTLTHCTGDGYSGEQKDAPMVRTGVQSLYATGTVISPSLQQQLREEIFRILTMYENEPLSLTITGHSLGASLAALAAYDIKTTMKDCPHVSVISFGGPRVGNGSFRQQLEQQGTKILRIVNSDDVITKVPGLFVEEMEDVEHEQNDHVAHLTGWIQKHIRDSGWVYANIGHELRLSSRDSLKLSSMDVATCHDLKTYLDLVNCFVSSSCPLRAGARRMLKKASTIHSLE